jgi:superfamily I DNA/RNA helicase/RecB family exonuclease
MAVSRRDPAFLPDPNQQHAIEHVSGPMLVVAGAGTGKTTVLTRRIARLVEQGHARPDEILAVTYTINAANEMRQRVQAELGKANLKGLQVETFHAFCNNLLIAEKRDFKVLDDKQLWIFLRRNIRDLRLNYYVRAANTAQFLDHLLEFIRRCHDELVGPEQYAEYVRRLERGELPVPRVSKSKDAEELSDEEVLGRCREIAFVFETVEGMLRERNFGTFSHQILRANDLLASDPALLERTRARARFVLVDEFQDANFAQLKVLEKLAGSDQNIFAVGDPDQGIYRFRGASSGAFELFQNAFPESKLVVLSKNRRSTTPILKCAHAIIAENPEFALNAGSEQYRRAPLISARDENEPGNSSSRLPVQAVLVTSSFMEATDLVSTLMERRRASRCDWKDIGILYRIHTHRDEVAAELAKNGIPFSIEGLDVLDSPEVRDLLSCFGAVVFTGDSAAWLRLAALRQFSVDPDELRSALKALPRDSAASMAFVLPKLKGGAALLESVEHAKKEVAGLKAYPTLLTICRHFQIPRTGGIDALLEFANQWEQYPITESGTPAEFLEYLDYFREAHGTIPLASSDNENAVKLMSAHSAKGLEFDHVFILRAVTNCFPTSYRESLIELPDDLRNSGLAADRDQKLVHKQEERRLFYVAMTRARDTLVIYGQFGKGRTERTPAGYLRELMKHRELKSWLKEKNCREFQTDIFAAAEPQPLSRIGEWVEKSPASDLASALSASALQSYKICPLRFKLEREWRIPSDPSAALQYGASIHRVLHTYFESMRLGRPKSDAEVLDQFRADLTEAGIADRYQHDLYEQQGIAQLTEFLSKAPQPDILHNEERFSIKIGSTTLVGRIDRMDRAADGHVMVIDYKTGKPKSQEDADESLQLSIYALAAREKWGYVAERLVLHNLDGNTAISTHRDESQLNEAKLEVEEIAGKIASGKFDPKSGPHCASCVYRVLCPKTEKRLPQARMQTCCWTSQLICFTKT